MCFSLKNAPSQVAQAETPLPFSRSSESRSSQRALAPVATITAFARYSSLSTRSEEHTSELQSRLHLVCRLLLEKKKNAAVSFLLSPLMPRLGFVRAAPGSTQPLSPATPPASAAHNRAARASAPVGAGAPCSRA